MRAVATVLEQLDESSRLKQQLKAMAGEIAGLAGEMYDCLHRGRLRSR